MNARPSSETGRVGSVNNLVSRVPPKGSNAASPDQAGETWVLKQHGFEIGAALSSWLRQLTGGAQLSLFITTT